MELQEWIDGKFTETDIDYQIADYSILHKNEEEILVKGVELLCDKFNPASVLEFGFGKGWTSSEFQKQGVSRHVILEPNKEVYDNALIWKESYNSNIEVLNIFSWDYQGDETFDLVYDDRQQFSMDDDKKHFEHMKKILNNNQLYSYYASKISENCTAEGTVIDFQINNISYIQPYYKELGF